MSGGKCGSHRPTGGSGDLTRGMLTVGVLFATPRNIPAATGCNSSSYTAWVQCTTAHTSLRECHSVQEEGSPTAEEEKGPVASLDQPDNIPLLSVL